MNNTYPLFEVLDARTDEPVNVCVWQVRAIYEVTIRGRKATRIEYANGQTLDSSDNCTRVVMYFHAGAQARGCHCHNCGE